MILIMRLRGDTQANIQQGDFISLKSLKKIVGYTQTDGQTWTDTQTDSMDFISFF
jgi:hypothetical protein